jgi:hypothetical protein
MRNGHRILLGKTKRRDHLEKVGVDGRNLKQLDVKVWTGFIWLRYGSVAGSC